MSTKNFAETFTLHDDQYLKIYTQKYANTVDADAYVETIISKYTIGTDGNEDTLVGTPYVVRETWTNTKKAETGTFQNFNMSVSETDYSAAPDYYDTTIEVAAQNTNPITKVGNNQIYWTDDTAGGTVIFTNTRRTVDITLKKVLEGKNIAAGFTFGVSYIADEVTTTRDDITVISGSETGTVIKKVPVGAVLTITEKGNDLLDYITTAKQGDNDLTITSTSETVSGKTTHFRSVTIDVTEATTITYKNVLKSVPIKIVKVGYDGTNTYNDVEAQFTMTQDITNVFTGRYSRPVNSTAPRGNIIYETGQIYSGSNVDGELYVGEYTLKETQLWGDYISLDDDTTINIVGTEDGVDVTVDGESARIAKDGDVWVVTVFNWKTADITVKAGLLDPMINQRSFTFAGSYWLKDLNGVNKAYTIDPFELIAFSTNDGSVAGGHEPKTISVPLGATGLQIWEDTSKVTTGTETIGSTYTVWVERNNTGRTLNDKYTYGSSFALENDNDVITFYNRKKTISVTVKKLVTAEDKTGTFTLKATLLNGNNPIKNYPIFINGTAENTSDDQYTDSSTGAYTFNLANNETYILTIPVSARLTIQEIGVSGNATGNDLNLYEMLADTTVTNTGLAYTGSTSMNEDAKLYTLTTAPSTSLTVTITNADNGKEVYFKKIDGFGGALSGARFSLYEDYACTRLAKVRVNNSKVDYAESTDSFLTTTDNVEYNVRFKAPLGVYYMKEINQVSGYEQNTNIYRIVVGKAGTTVEGISLPTGKEYLIQQMSSATSYDTVPDIAKYGVLNISLTKQKAIIKKTNDNFEPLAGAQFNILRYDRTMVSSTDANGVTTTTFTSGANGLYFVDNLPNGTYYIHEIVTPVGYQTLAGGDNWYRLTVNNSGVSVSNRLSVAP